MSLPRPTKSALSFEALANTCFPSPGTGERCPMLCVGRVSSRERLPRQLQMLAMAFQETDASASERRSRSHLLSSLIRSATSSTHTDARHVSMSHPRMFIGHLPSFIHARVVTFDADLKLAELELKLSFSFDTCCSITRGPRSRHCCTVIGLSLRRCCTPKRPTPRV